MSTLRQVQEHLKKVCIAISEHYNISEEAVDAMIESKLSNLGRLLEDEIKKREDGNLAFACESVFWRQVKDLAPVENLRGEAKDSFCKLFEFLPLVA